MFMHLLTRIARHATVAAVVAVVFALVAYPALAVNYDNANAAMQVSLYGMGTVAGDTALRVGDINNATSAAAMLQNIPACRYNATPPTLTDTRYNALQCGSTGNLRVDIAASTGTAAENLTQVASTSVQSGGISNAAPTAGMQDVLAGCRYNSAVPSLTNTRTNTLQCGIGGGLIVALGGDNGKLMDYAATPTDATTNAFTSGYAGFWVLNRNFVYNGTTWDFQRSSSVGTGMAVAAPPDYSFLNVVAGQATTTVKSGAGFLHAVCFNSAAAATNITTIYDNTAGSGTVIAIPAATTATVPTCLTYDLKFSTGVTVVTGTANGSNMTFVYR